MNHSRIQTRFLQRLGRSLPLARLGRRRPTQGPITLLQESAIAGYNHHRAPAIWSFMRVGDELSLRREHHNPHDRNAIAVYFKYDRLGYVPRRENATLAQLMDRGAHLKANIIRLLDTENPWRRIRIRVGMMG